MPQLDSSSFLPQLVWLAISFVAFYLLMIRVALPRVSSVLDRRQKQLDDDVKHAIKLKADAEAALAAYEKVLAEARAGAQAELSNAAASAAKEAGERQAAFAAEVAA